MKISVRILDAVGKFIEAQDYDKKRADHILELITNIDKIERKCKNDNFDPKQIQKQRDLVIPII